MYVGTGVGEVLLVNTTTGMYGMALDFTCLCVFCTFSRLLV